MSGGIHQNKLLIKPDDRTNVLKDQYDTFVKDNHIVLYNIPV